MMFQNFAKNTCTGMKFKAICYEWQYACELKEILWHWEIRMHEFLKEQPCTQDEMVFSSIKHDMTEKCLPKKWCRSNNNAIHVSTYCTIVPCNCLLSWTIHWTMTYYNLSMYLSIAPRWNLRLQIFLTSIENNNYFAINTMSLYVHIHCIKAKLQQLLNAQETFKYNFK